MALSWTVKPNLGNGSWWGTMYAAGALWAWETVWTSAHAGSIVSSTDDGLSWSAPGGALIDDFQPYAMAWNGSTVLVAVGNGLSTGTGREAYYRVSGVWTATIMPLPVAIWTGVAWNGVGFCAVSTAIRAATSTTGTGWVNRAMPAGTVFDMPFIIAHGTVFLASSRSDSNVYRSTNNGASFVAAAMPSTGWQMMASNGTRIVAVGYNKVAYSNNAGVSWTEVALTGSWVKVAWNGAEFCAISDDSPQGYTTSVDGITWVARANLPPGIFPVGKYMTTNATAFYFTDYQSLLKSAPFVGTTDDSSFFHFSF